MKLAQIVAVADARTLKVHASHGTALRGPGQDAPARADGATHVVAGTAWSDVAILEFPVFNKTLSIVVT